MAAFLRGTLFALAACSLLMVATPSRVAAGRPHRMGRHQQLHFFFHDKLNVTDVLIAEHAPGPITLTAAPYGAIFVINDRITVTKDPNSLLLGAVSGLATSASFDGTTNFCTFTIALDSSATNAAECPSPLKGLHGTINLFGLVSTIKPQKHAISGGTGSFMLVQGTSLIVPIYTKTFNQIYRIDLDLYWPY